MPEYSAAFSKIPKSIRHMFPEPGKCKIPPGNRMHKKIALAYILWLVGRTPMTGYEIMKLLETQHQKAMANASRIYPILIHLEEEGLIRSKILKKGKRESKRYSITQKGKTVLSTIRKLHSGSLWGEFLQDISGG